MKYLRLLAKLLTKHSSIKMPTVKWDNPKRTALEFAERVRNDSKFTATMLVDEARVIEKYLREE